MQQSKLCPPHRTQESDIPPDVEKQLPEFGFPVQSQSGVFLYILHCDRVAIWLGWWRQWFEFDHGRPSAEIDVYFITQ